MFRKLRIRFIAVAMCAITLVLAAIIGFINIRSYTETVRSADRTLALLRDNGGHFPAPRDPGDHTTPAEGVMPPTGESDEDRDSAVSSVPADPSSSPAADPGSSPARLPGFSPETPYETRFFTVTLDADGEITAVNIEKIAAIDQDTARSYAASLWQGQKTSGFQGDYRYLSFLTTEGDTMYIFLDCTRSLQPFREFLRTSLIVSLSGLLVVFLLVIFFSGLVMRPMAEMYRKQKRFITDANHELKTPLTVISADCEILEYHTGENEWTRTIREQVEHLTALTNQLVFLSRMDEGSTKGMMTDFSLSEIAEEAVQPYVAVAQTQGKQFRWEIAANLSCHGDMTMIRELISLLLDNAMKYSDAAGNIVFSLTPGKNSRSARITVSNTTDGIPKGDLDVLFERFYRLDPSRNSGTGGHGIGLSIARSIVEWHKGKISAFSPDGKTICFTVLL